MNIACRLTFDPHEDVYTLQALKRFKYQLHVDQAYKGFCVVWHRPRIEKDRSHIPIAMYSWGL